MSKWLQAARSARASKPGSEPFYAHANSAISANSPPERPNGTIGTIGTGVESLTRAAHLAVVPDLSDREDIRVWLDERAAMREDSGTTRIDADKLVFDELLWIMPQFWKAVPPLTPAALFNEHAEGEKEDGHGDHEGYTDETLRRAITQGVDPGGKPLDRAMPEWSMSTQDLDDLIAYLKSPAVKPR